MAVATVPATLHTPAFPVFDPFGFELTCPAEILEYERWLDVVEAAGPALDSPEAEAEADRVAREIEQDWLERQGQDDE